MDEKRIKYCNACQKKEKKSCVGCEYDQPQLLVNNQESFDLWVAMQTQWRSQATGLDYNVLWKIADTIGIVIDRAVLNKIKALELYMIGWWAHEHNNSNIKRF